VALSTTARATAADATKEVGRHACIAASERAQEDRRTGEYQEARAAIAMRLDAACPGPIREDCTRLLGEVEAAGLGGAAHADDDDRVVGGLLAVAISVAGEEGARKRAL
jgi:hypothetical protein